MTRRSREFALPATGSAVLFVCVALLPLGLAWLSGAAPGHWHEEAALALGMVGLSLLLLQFAHGGRWRFVTGRTGIDVTMRFHRAAALLVAACVLLHPLAFHVPVIAQDPVQALQGLVRMLMRPRMLSGVLAWAFLLATVALALARGRLRYGRWRLAHGVGALLSVLLGLHHVWTVGYYSASAPLAAFWLLGTAGALALLGWSWWWKPRQLASAGWQVERVEPLGPGYWELRLQVRDAAPGARAFQAGQFAWLRLGGHSPWDDNPFSYAGAPGEQGLRFVIREAGDMTSRLGHLPRGLPVAVDGPHGTFTLAHAGAGPLLLVAGGAGIAPVLSMLRSLHQRGDPRPLALVHAARTADRLIARAEVQAMARSRGWRTLFLCEDADPPEGVEAGRVDPERLARLLQGWPVSQVHVMICGPLPMTMATARQLEHLGVAPGHIHYELFDYA